MKLPELDQLIELERGEAAQLWQAIQEMGRTVAFRLSPEGHGFVPAHELLALTPLGRVARRLQRLNARERQHVGKPRRRPHAFRLAYDELVALYQHVPCAGAEAVFGKIHQKTLNLRYVRF